MQVANMMDQEELKLFHQGSSFKAYEYMGSHHMTCLLYTSRCV